MLRDEEIESEPARLEGNEKIDWQVVDRELRLIARRRSALDADEARWLREAEALQIWKPFGMVSALDYMERVLGYAPRTAQDRLRVARALADLPALNAALGRGELPFSAVRELTRVAQPRTEAAWTAAAADKTLRQIEELVAGHRPGDLPDDPADPDVRTHVVQFEVSPETFAAMRQARALLADERGGHLEDDAFVAALAHCVIAGGSATDPNGRAKFQIAVTVCERCRQSWQEGAGAKIAIGEAAVERAECDAQHVGSIDGTVPERAHQDVSPTVIRLVWGRDHGHCRVPGCRSARSLEIHHIVRRADGGDHEASNLVLLCGSCHKAHHDERLAITGTADQLVVRRMTGAHVGASTLDTAIARTQAQHDERLAITGTADRLVVQRMTDAHPGAKLDTAIIRTQAKQVLVKLGWKAAVALAAVDAAWSDLGPDVEVTKLIFEALRRCG